MQISELIILLTAGFCAVNFQLDGARAIVEAAAAAAATRILEK